MAITQYLNLITSEHNNQPNYMNWLSDTLQKVDDCDTMTSGMVNDFTVANAVGNQLDLLGTLVGSNRNIGVTLSSTGTSLLDDAHYRLLIQAKIAQNQWDGTIPGIYNVWYSVFPSSGLRVTDNQNMTLSATISGITDATTEEMINSGLVLPKPMGVSYSSITFSTIMTWNGLEASNATWDMVGNYTWDELELSSSVT